MRLYIRHLLALVMVLTVLGTASCKRIKLDPALEQIKIRKVVEKNDQLFLFNAERVLILRHNSTNVEVGGIQVVLPDAVLRDSSGMWHLPMRSVQIVSRLMNPVPLHIRTVVIDPGHGGKDTGTLSVTGKKAEKNLNLDLALRLGTALQRAGLTVLYTRDDDSTVALGTRGTKFKADLFVSIHHNASSRIGASGAETFCLLSADNRVPDKVLAAVDIACAIQNAQSAVSGNYGRGVKFANFRVLRDSACPAILFETGFLSNPDDEKKCLSPQWRQLMAEALAQGIIRAVLISVH